MSGVYIHHFIHLLRPAMDFCHQFNMIKRSFCVLLIYCLSIYFLLIGIYACGSKQEEPKVDHAFRSNLAEILLEAKAFEDAAPLVQRLVNESPEQPSSHYLLGFLLREKGSYQEAHKAFLKAIEIAPKYADPYAGLGILYALQKENTKAISMFLKAIELDDKNPKYHNNLGFIYYLSKQYQKADESYRKSVSLAPTETKVYVNMAFNLAQMDRFDEANELFQKNLTQAEAINNIGLVLESKGKWKEAKERYLKALELNPRLNSAKKNLQDLEDKIRKTPNHP
jgi:Tfp pilus assembly protein PilF